MLTRANRSTFHSLLDAITLQATGGTPTGGPDPVGADRPAVIYVETGRPDFVVSRADFRRELTAHAAGLQAMGVRPRDLVVIAHTQNLESIFAFWGAMFMGAIPSMFPTLTEKLDPQVYMEAMAELVRLSAVKAILTTDEFAPVLAGQVNCPVYASEELAASIAANGGLDWPAFAAYKPDPAEIAFLQHSSGTTGLQKGVALSHQAVLNQLASYGEAIELKEDDVVVSWLPLYHDMGLIAGFLMPFFQGLPLVLMSPFDWVQHPALLFRAIHDHHGTLCWLPNFAYNHCSRRIRRRDTEGLSLAGMRLFINCSEPVYRESHRLFLERFAANGLRPEMLAVSYAMAENTFGVTQTPPGRTVEVDIIDQAQLVSAGLAVPVDAGHPEAVAKVSCGPPIAGTAVRVIGDRGQVLPERAVGQLAVKSDCMLSEYYRRPDLQPFLQGWYMTGDRGYLAGGQVYIVGRSKDLIINAGKNIYPQDIEAIVNQVPGVHPGRVVAFGVPDRREGTELIAVVVEVKNGDAAGQQALKAAIRYQVARQSLVTVSYVQLVGPRWLIKTSSGKIARAANRDKWLRESGPGNPP